jgi:hypothetical protein
MRVLHAAVLTMAALFLASITSAQGLGAAAAREKERRNTTPDKPTRVYTDKDVATVPDAPAPAAEGDAKSGDGKGADGKSGDGKTDEEKAAAAEQAAREKAQADWRGKLDDARRTAVSLQETINKLNAELGDQSSIAFGPGRTYKLNLLDETKKKLADAQANVASLEEEGRRKGYN